jgi:hypothetical protein
MIDKNRINELDSISRQLNEALNKFRKTKPARLEVTKILAEILGMRSKGVFTSLELPGAAGFTDRFSMTGQKIQSTVISYSITFVEVEKLLGSSIYIGFEGDYFEFAFLDYSFDQRAKFLLFQSITGAQNESLKPE